MQTIDWTNTLLVEQWNTGHVHIKYQVPTDLTETEVRQNMLYWELGNVWGLFKIFKISDNLMREIQSNLSEDDLRALEHEIMLDMYLIRQCFVEQIENYLTYIRSCKVQYEEALKDKRNAQKLLRRLDRMRSSFSYDGEVASFVDYNGCVQDQIVL